MQERLEAWLKVNLGVGFKELEPQAAYDVIVAVQKEFLPRAFSVEFGAYVNAIRSSLDLVATALAHRHGIARPDKAYFPILETEVEFRAGKYKGRKFVEGLPAAERQIIEDLKPYKRGHRCLWGLHYLDAMRKHRRLLGVAIAPKDFSMGSRGNISDWVTPISTGLLSVTNYETVLAHVKKGAPQTNVRYTPQVAISEATFGPIPLAVAINDFSCAANRIIDLFDY